jgi:hypothetical protein
VVYGQIASGGIQDCRFDEGSWRSQYRLARARGLSRLTFISKIDLVAAAELKWRGQSGSG